MSKILPGRPLRPDRCALIVALSIVLASACTAGPVTGPEMPTVGKKETSTSEPFSDRDQNTPEEGEGQLLWEAPLNEIEWSSCGPSPSDELLALPAEAIYECADFNPQPTDGSLTLVPIHLERLRSQNTPPQAPPLVIVGDSERHSSELLRSWSMGPAIELADFYPLVAMDHRGVDTQADDCLGTDLEIIVSRRGPTDTPEAVNSLVANAGTASVKCLDTLEQSAQDFGARGASRDLTALRKYWGVGSLGLLTVGDGIGTAMEYAHSEPEHLARLVVDSATPWNAGMRERTEILSRGASEALAMHSRTCPPDRCPQPQHLKNLSAATDPTQPRAAEDPTGAENAYLLRLALARLDGSEPTFSRSIGAHDLIAELSAPDQPISPDRYSALERIRKVSLQFVARCTDAIDRVATAEITEIGAAIDKQAPVFSSDLSSLMTRCSAWPLNGSSDLTFPAIPVVTVGSAADPLGGTHPAKLASSLLQESGADSAEVIGWNAPGSVAVAHSSCVRRNVLRYLDNPAQSKSTSCPW